MFIFKLAPLGLGITPMFINLKDVHISRKADIGLTSKSVVLFTLSIVVLLG